MRSLRSRSILPLSLILAAGSALGCKSKAAQDEGPGGDGGKVEAPAETPEAEPSLDELLAGHEFPLLIWSIHIVQQDYFDKSRFDPRGQVVAAADYLGLHTPEFFATVEGDTLEVTVRSQAREFSLADLKKLDDAANLLEQVVAFTVEVLALDGEPLHELEYAAINGFLGPLDPHTILLTPEENAELGIKTRGSFGGIGAEIAARDRRITVVRVLPDSPAQAAGVRDGDVILEIDGQSTVNLSSADAQALLRGPVKTDVEIEISRGDQRLTITITRGQIAIPTVIAEMLPERVGYVQVTTFQEDTAAKLLEALQGFQREGELSGLVMDLRGNSGGLLAQAVGILNQFVKGGELVIVHSALGREHQDATPEIVVPMKVPVVVLIDQDAASASEIVGGSMKHLDRGVIVGRASFGKGTVQELRKATPYGRELALKMTIAEYRVAGDRKIQSIGVIPDVQLLPIELLEYEGVGRYYDLERFERQRERARTAHLPSAGHDAHAAAEAAMAQRGLSLRYLAYGPGQTPATPKPGDEQPRQMLDPEIRLAREIALGLRGHEGRRDQVAALPKVVEGLAASEDQAVRAAMAPWSVDWSPVDDPADEDTPLEVAVALTGDGPHKAGAPFTLHVEVHNPSGRTLERVHLITDCARDELDGIELLIGKLEPGAQESRDVLLQVMPWHVDFVDTLSVAAHVGEPEGTPDGQASVRFAIAGAPRPRFSFDYWIIDDPRLAAKGPSRPAPEPGLRLEPFVVQGNGDGLLQPGEQVLLGFRVHNAAGPAGDARVLLRNLSGRQGLLEEGLFAHGPLATGAAFMGAFGISISANADPALPLELELIAGDGIVRESVDDKLPFRVAPGRDAVAEVEVEGSRRKVAQDHAPARIYNGADASTPVIAELPAGAVIEVSGVAGEWLAIDGQPGEGRRSWIPADVVEAGGGAPAKLPRDRRMVDPPVLELAPIGEGEPGVVRGETVTIAGIAQHPQRVRDVVVTVRASGPAQVEHKVFYLANRALEGEEAKSLEFRAEVPLAPGSNRVLILARDHDKVERRQELWVFREQEAAP